MNENVRVSLPVTGLPVRIVSLAWGDSYLDELLSFSLPALLAPGNLPYIASQVECELTLVTEERLFARIAAHPVIARVQKFCPVRLVGLDDLVTRTDKYGMVITYAMHRAFADLGPAMTDCWLIFFNADFVMADGSLRNLLAHLRRGERIVASPSYCAVKEEVIPELKRRLAADPTVLAIAPRDMARLILRHRHNTIRGQTINQPRFHLSVTYQFYWAVDDDTLLGHQMPVAIVGLRPQRYLSEPNSFWDHGLINELCPNADVAMLGDSDEFLMLELRSGTVAHDHIVPGPLDPRELGERLITWMTPYQASFARRPLTLHAADLPPATEAARKKLDDFVAGVFAHAPSFASHLDHPQWNYHWPDFMRSRYEFLSNKLGIVTETGAPPPATLSTDKVWWRLDGSEKTLSRKIRLASEKRDQRIGGLVNALRQVETDLDRLLSETMGPAWDLSNRLHASVRLGQEVEQTPAIKDAIERKRLAEQAIAEAEQSHGELMRPLETEYARVQSEYNALVRPRVKSAGIPIVRWRSGTDLKAVSNGHIVRRAARFAYHQVFGRWPRVTRLNPLWAAAQPLLRAVEQAKARGAKDVLIVSDNPGLARGIASLRGTYALVSNAGFRSELFDKALEQRAQFDLCVIDLTAGDLVEFSDVIATTKPYMREGGTIVAFHVNGFQELQAVPPAGPDAKIVFTGSAASAAAMAYYADAVSRGQRSRLRRIIRLIYKVALHLPQFWWANRGEATAAKQGREPEARFRTSVTVTVRGPWVVGDSALAFEGDDGSPEYAVACGVYLGAPVEAPVEASHRVDPDVALDPDAAVILTFGQSNAANAGSGRYRPRREVYAFNMFDMHCYRAIDPLPGTTNDGGSVWSRLGDKLIEAGLFRSVVFVPIAVGGSFIKDWAAPTGYCRRRLQLALTRLKRAGISIDLLCWHQGEADANHATTSAQEYAKAFQVLVDQIRDAGVNAPIYSAVASLCENAAHPYHNHEQIRLAQRQIVCPREGILPGPDTDRFNGEYREDGCHFSERGLDAVAQAWLECIVRQPPRRHSRLQFDQASHSG